MPSDKSFAFDLGQQVKARVSGEVGVVIGRAEYVRASPSYFVEYLTADRRQAQAWFDEDSLKGTSDDSADERTDAETPSGEVTA